MAQQIEVLVEGGKASGGPPLGPALGPLGLNINEVVGRINQETAKFAGMKVPVTITVTDPNTRKYEISVGTPPASSLLLREAGAGKGSSDPLRQKVGNITGEQLKKIAEMKHGSTLSSGIENTMKEIVGTAVSVGVTIDGKDPREIKNISEYNG
jgi:large subunit ribosomal protein L11